MKLETVFGPGDRAWVWNGSRVGVEELTIGQVRLEVTESGGTGETMFSNYSAQKGRLEQYMCVETGVGSGSVYTYGKNIFKTREACLKAFARSSALRSSR